MKSKQVLICAGLLFLTGCAIHIPYVPNPLTTIASPKAIIEQVIQEQPPEYTPIHVIVTDDYFKMITYVPYPDVAYPVPTIIYYNNIGLIKLYKELGVRTWYLISIWDKSKFFKCQIYTSQEIQAKSFIDALSIMMGQNVAKPPK